MTFLIDAFKSIIASVLDTTAFDAQSTQAGASAESYMELNTDGSATLVGSISTSPSSPRWWSTGSPPATWVSYTATGSGGAITGGLAASTRYQLNTIRKIGLERTSLGVANRTVTLTFFDAASGGTTLGTKTLTLFAEFA